MALSLFVGSWEMVSTHRKSLSMKRSKKKKQRQSAQDTSGDSPDQTLDIPLLDVARDIAPRSEATTPPHDLPTSNRQSPSARSPVGSQVALVIPERSIAEVLDFVERAALDRHLDANFDI